MIDPLELLGPDGPIARQLDDYELRQEQLDMAEAIGSSISNKRHLVVEAGTGTGKSFAYTAAVLPFLDDTHKRKIVISTYTISLQEQLNLKDIPFLKKAGNFDFKAVLVKGRGNYLCWRRLDKAMAAGKTLFEDDWQYDQLTDIKQWAMAAREGSLSDMDFTPERSVWELVRCDPAICPGRRCRMYDSCFYQKARKQAYNADILIVNHALLFTDLAARLTKGQVLPDYNYIIFDEAHNMEKTAGSHFGLQLSNYQVRYMLNRLFNKKSHRGVLAKVMTNSTNQFIEECMTASNVFFEEVERFDSDSRKNGSNSRVMKPQAFMNCLSGPLEKLANDITRIADNAVKDDDRMEYLYYVNKCKSFAISVDQFVSQSVDTPCVYWVESHRNRFGNLFASLNASPLNLGPVLKEALFDSFDSVVMTSATISIAGRNEESHKSLHADDEGGIPPGFRYFTKRVGLNKCDTLHLGSPFNYETQAKVYIEAALPEPRGNSEVDFMEQAVDAIKQYLAMTHGRAFILFTSFVHLKKVANALESFCISNNINLLVHGAGANRQDILEKFRYDTNSVLLGVDSFWQGVDVRGESLSNVIIFKLPFAVPTHPLQQARMEKIAADGGSPFFDYQIPEAVLKLKQGFGRLIRSASDKGIVVILDPRIVTKAYGSMFVEALPKCPVQIVRSPDDRVKPEWLVFE